MDEETRYSLAVERAFQELGGPATPSPRGDRGGTTRLAPQDSAAVKSWYEAGVEYETIWRCFRQKSSSSGLTDGSGRPIRTLRYFHEIVHEAHRLIVQLRGPWARDPPEEEWLDPEERAPTIESGTWDTILGRLKDAPELEPEEWDTWFWKLDPQEESEGRLVLQAPNEHFAYILTQAERLRTALASAARGTSVWVTDGWCEPMEVRA